MDFLTKLARKINGNVITRNLVLALCALIVFLFVVNLLLNFLTRHGREYEVPSLNGMTLEQARQAGRKASLQIEINDSLYVPSCAGGIILEQSPSEGAKVKSGRRVFVTINSFHQKKVDIPYVTGYSLRQAKNNLEMAGLEIKELIYREDIATNNVLEERYDGKVIRAGSKQQAEVGSGVTLVVGMGEDAVTQQVPRLVGFSAREAKSRLWEAGFNVGKIGGDEDVTPLNEHEAWVYMQNPPPGSHRPLGSKVNFALTLDSKRVEKGKAESDRAARAEAKAREDSLSTIEKPIQEE